MRTGISVLFGLVLVLASSDVRAHHSFAAQYDADKPVTLVGTVTKVEWTNPHSHFYLDVKDASGKVVNWKYEGYNAAVLMRVGWKRDTMLKPGDTITVSGWQARVTVGRLGHGARPAAKVNRSILHRCLDVAGELPPCLR